MLPKWAVTIGVVCAAIVVASIVLVSVTTKQDWSQYTSDLTSGVIVGSLVAVIVGYVLWRWQDGAELASRKRQADAAWAITRELVRADLDGPWDLSVTGSDLWDRDWNQVAELYAGRLHEQVPGWALDSPGNVEVRLTRDLLAQGAALKRMASRLNFQIGVEIGAAHRGSGFKDQIKPAAWMTLRGHDEFVLGPQNVIDAAERVLAVPEIGGAAEEYLLAVRKAQDTYRELWARLEPGKPTET
jgi:hypothetical protein